MKLSGGFCLLLVLALAACGQEADDIRLAQMTCPSVAVPAYSRDLVQWQGDGHDLTNLAYRLRLSDAQGQCTRKQDNDNLYTSLTVTLNATRGPALAGRAISADYFVAVMRGNDILDKQTYTLSGVFPPNTEQLTLTGMPVTMTLPLSTQVTGGDYTIATGLQLTQAQIDDNRTAQRR